MPLDSDAGRSYDFFLAHASSDKPRVEPLWEALSQRYRVFFDKACVVPGDNWDVVIQAAQRDSFVTIVAISSNTPDSHYAGEEIGEGIHLSRQGDGHRVVPVYLDGWSDDIPYGLRRKHGIDFAAASLEEVVEGLVRALHAVQGGDPLARVLGAFESTARLREFLLKEVDPAETARALHERFEDDEPHGRVAARAARALREGELLTTKLKEALLSWLPRKHAGAVRAVFRDLEQTGSVETDGRGAPGVASELGRAPLPDATVHLDRISQWRDLRERSSSMSHELFFLHGPENQFLEDFTLRVRRYLNEVCGRSNRLHVVSADPDGSERPNLPMIWESRFAAAVNDGAGARAVSALRAAAGREPVFVLFGDQPFNSGVAREDEFGALETFISERLGEIILDADPTHHLRLYAAVEERDGCGWTRRLKEAFEKLAQRIGADFEDPEPVDFPPYREVAHYVLELDLNPPRAWWDELEALWQRHRDRGGHFRDFCRDLDRLLRRVG